jgi:hypothetical protein
MEHIKTLAEYRYEKALGCLIASKSAIGQDDYYTAANRSYYAVFHAMRSILALRQIDFGNHGKVIGYFRREFIKTQVFPKEMSYTIDTLFDTRNKSDYDDFFLISKDEVAEQLKSAEIFLAEIRAYLDK